MPSLPPVESQAPPPGLPDPALAAAWDRLEAPLLRYATRILRDPTRARDVVHDAFVRLCEAKEKPDDVAAWLFQVCKNEAIDAMRRERRSAPLEEAELYTVEPDAEQRRAVAEVLRAIDELPPKQRQVLTLRVADGHDYRRISQLTGMSISHVGVMIHQATRSLRVRLAAALVIALLLAGGAWRTWPRPRPPILAKHLELPEISVPLPEPENAPMAGDPPPEQTPAPTHTPAPGPAKPPGRAKPPPPRTRLVPSML